MRKDVKGVIMKTISEYIDIAYNELINIKIYENGFINCEDEITVNYIFKFAMQLSEQDHQKEMQLSKQNHDIEIERLRAQLRRFEPASEKQLNYIRSLIKDNDILGKIVIDYLKDKSIEQIPRLDIGQASELITLIKEAQEKEKIENELNKNKIEE